MKKAARRFLCGLCLIFVLVLLLPGIILLSLETKHGRQLALREANRLLNGSLSVGGFHTSLWQGEFQFRDASLRDAGGCELAGFDALLLKVSWPAMLHGDLTATEARLERPRARLQFEPRGGPSLVRIFTGPGQAPEARAPGKAAGSGFPFNIVVRNLDITGGSAVFEVASPLEPGDPSEPAVQPAQVSIQPTQAAREGPAVAQVALSQGAIQTSETAGESGAWSIEVGPIDLTVSADLFRLQGDLKLRAGRVRVEGPATRADFEAVDLRAALQEGSGTADLKGKVAGGSLSLHGQVGLADTFPYGFLGPPVSPAPLSYSLVLEQKDVNLEGVLKTEDTGGLRGKLTSSLSVSGLGVSPASLAARARVSLTAERLANQQFPDGIDLSVQAEAGLEAGVVKLDRLEAKTRELGIEAQGRYALADHALQAKAFVKASSLARTLSLLRWDGASGSLEAEALVSGEVQRPGFSCSIRGKGLRFRQVSLGNLEAQASLDAPGTLSVARLEVRNQGSVIQAEGLVRLFETPFVVSTALPGKLTASLRNVEVRDFVAADDFSGNLNGDLLLQNGPAGPHGTFSVNGSGLALGFARLGDLDARLALAGDTVRLEQVQLKNRDSSLSVSGSARVLEKGAWRFLRSPLLDLRVAGTPLELEDFRDGWHGEISLQATLRGSLSRPEGSVRLKGEEIDLGFQKIAAIGLDSTLGDARARLDALRITLAPGETLDCTGWLSPGQGLAYDLRLSSTGVSLSSVDWIREHLRAEGKAAFELAGSGTLKDPSLEGGLRVTGFTVNGTEVHDLDLRIRVADQQARATGDLGFRIDAGYHLKTRDFSASLGFDRTELIPVFALLGQSDLHGTVTGTVQVQGNPARIRDLQGTADFSALNLTYQGEEVLHTGDVHLTCRDEAIRTPGFTISLPGEGRVEVKGGVSRQGPFQVELGGNASLEGLRPLVPSLPDLEGNLQLTFTAGGTLARPVLNGEVNIRNAGFTIPELMQNLRDLDGQVRLSGEQVTIERLAGRIDTGRFNLTGRVDLAALRPAAGRLRLTTEALPIRVPDSLDLVVDTNLDLEKAPAGARLQGDILLREGLYYRDIKLHLLQEVSRPRREEALPPARLNIPYLGETALDVSVRSRRALSVENNLAEMEVRPDLRVTGKLSNPVLTGRAEVVSGIVTYQRKDFVIRKGVIDFLNPYRIEPTLDIRSDVQIRKWIVTLNISGTPDDLRFELSSQPPEQQADIVSLLLLGKTNSELAGGAAGPAQSPSQMLAQIMASSLGEQVKKGAGLDILRVESVEPETPASPEGTRVTLGKKFSRRITVKYQVEYGTTKTVQRAITEYKLLEDLLATGYQDTTGAFGGGLLYRIEFR